MLEFPRYYRDPFPNLPPITESELIGKNFFLDAPQNQEEKIIWFLTTTPVRAAIATSWSESTKYPENSKFGPPVKYEHTPNAPNGQCGVTAMMLGMEMVRFGIAPPEKIFYEEGKLLNAAGEIIDDHHAWLRIEGDDDKEWRIDLTSYQYAKAFTDPDQLIEIVVQGVRHGVGHYSAINFRYEDPYIHPAARRLIPVPNALSLQYEVDEIDGKKCSTPISEYNVSLFEGRLERFNYKYAKRLGEFAINKKAWYPPNYDPSKETWNPHEDINIIYQEKSIHAVLEARSPVTLAMWAHDCAMHALRLRKDSDVYEDLRLALDLSERSVWKNDVNKKELLDTAHAWWIFFLQSDYDESTKRLAASVGHALLTAADNRSLGSAKSAATDALLATYHNDPSDLKMSVVEELEWQKRHLDVVIEIAEQ